MSILYGVDVKLKIAFNRDFVFKALKKGKELDFTYFDDSYSVISDIDCALEKLFFVTDEIKDDGGPNIWTKFEDTYFSLWINKAEEGQDFSIISIG